MAVVVSDTSPIRALEHLKLLNVLVELFGDVLVPPAVAAELQRPPGNLIEIDVAQLPFIRVQAPRDLARCLELHQTLDRGESEALSLALEVNAEAVLIDEAAGREMAARLGLSPIGVLGILLKAKARGKVTAIAPCSRNCVANSISSSRRTSMRVYCDSRMRNWPDASQMIASGYVARG